MRDHDCVQRRSRKRICRRSFAAIVCTFSPPRAKPLVIADGYSLAYATSSLNMPPTHLIARIGRSNTPSIALFKSLGFGISKVVEVFDEVEMRWGHKANQNTDNSSDSFAPISAFDSVNEPRSLGYSIPEGRIGIYDPPNLKS